jgi:chromosome condensin MukBEF complex kleisin-like MukF subunit
MKMPKSYEFSQDMKEIFFNVIQFVEKEKFGPVIPLFNVNERLSSMLAISMRSVERLKSEMKEIEHDMMEKKRKMDEEKEELENQKLQVLGRLRNLRSRSSSSSSTSSVITTNAMAISVPVPRSPHKLSNSGR